MRQVKRAWTDKQEGFLRSKAGKMGAESLAHRMNRTTGAIRQKALTLGLSLSTRRRRGHARG